MFLGIDLGTSSIKALLVDDEQRIVAEASEPLTVDRPRPLWSEQSPEAWWSATAKVAARLRDAAKPAFSAVRGIGLSGQMHGATLLDSELRVLRPAILWNDGRSGAECEELEAREPRAREITGNAAMPGFTAPKLLWVARHEPDVFARTARVLLPKDWLRLKLTGELMTDPSDAAGTLWLDVARRRWSGPMLAACGLSELAMARVVEGTEPTGTLSAEVASAWGLSPSTVVAGGGGGRGRCGRHSTRRCAAVLGDVGSHLPRDRWLCGEPCARRARLLSLRTRPMASNVGDVECGQLPLVAFHGHGRGGRRCVARRGRGGSATAGRRSLSAVLVR
jgi:xylulokinase